jgi:hypothetical protein
VIRKIIVPAACLLIGLAAGAWFGYRFMAQPPIYLGAVAESFILSQHASTQAREASYGEAQRALEQYLIYLKSIEPHSGDWKPGQNPLMDERIIRLEKTLAWAKVALLHERNQNPSEAARAWDEAETLARLGTWRDPSRDNLREIVARQLAPAPAGT